MVRRLMLLVHGGRALLWYVKRAAAPDRLRRWALQVAHRRGHSKAAVALANKLARLAWAVWTADTPFTTQHRTAVAMPA
jgi:transposase